MTGTSDGPEKRRYRRYNARRPIRIKSGQHEFKGLTVNISAGGALLDVGPIELTEPLEIEIPDLGRFSARVVRVSAELLAVQFLDGREKETQKKLDRQFPVR